MTPDVRSLCDYIIRFFVAILINKMNTDSEIIPTFPRKNQQQLSIHQVMDDLAFALLLLQLESPFLEHFSQP